MNNMENSVKNVLHMESITMQFGGVVAVNGLTLDVNEHEIVALIGPNGAGKTTAFNCVTGIYQPTFGSVSFNGEVILADTPQGKMRRLYEGDIAPTDLTPVRKTPDQVTKLGIARTFQNIRLFGALTVFENVLIAKHMRAKQNVFSATLRLNHAEGKTHARRVHGASGNAGTGPFKGRNCLLPALRTPAPSGDCQSPGHQSQPAPSG